MIFYTFLKGKIKKQGQQYADPVSYKKKSGRLLRASSRERSGFCPFCANA